MSVTGGPPSTHEEEVEERVGPYRLIRRLGQGGMGVVYLAEGPEHQEVALKVLRPHVAHDPIARARLQREATTLQKVNHPGVAGILDHDLESEQPYLVTRFVPGRPLDEQVDERGPLTPRKWLPLAGCLAESLQAIHAVGVIHRDLKPGNVMMCNGKPVMIDFGIAQAADDLRLTQTGLVIGTPGYLAPELIEGEMVSQSADWWGWAATVAFAATGRRPFGKGPFEAVLARVHSGQADLDGLDPRLKSLLAAALAPDKADRPTQEEIMTGLSRYAEGRDALPPREAPTVAAVPPTRLVTKQLPLDEPTDEPAVEEPTGPTPTQVAELVPQVIPPLSAFTPIRDKIRDAAAKKPVAEAPAYGPVPYAPSPYAAGPYEPVPYAPPYQGPYQNNAPVPYQQPSQPAPAQPAHPVKAPPTGRRTAVVVGFMVALTGLVALTPGIGAVVAVVLLVLARTVDRSSTALMRRRQVRGRAGKSDGVVTLAASPLQLATAVLITIPCLILPLLTAVVVGGIVTGVAASAYGLDWPPLSALGFGTAALTALFCCWWGPGGSSLRRGAHITARNTFRPRWFAALIAVVLLAIGGIAFYQATQGAGAGWARTPIQTPNIERPTLGDLRNAPFIRDLPVIGN
ncbi:serine/threonine-protein kinase [Kribbella shirazensis]|uniref:Serine/threonine protein kinase n=1 Tax=Kribbella shirazensis TaxID=1105143 RepID=A0A7X5V762_9ACTN|nr:serine/threonine-protein kinase [Kribbella shirazensis]NIK55886.1 serine/threonine protein kinase [Kribbella shirazensis]